MPAQTQQLLQLYAAAIHYGTETTLAGLIDVFGFASDGKALEQVEKVRCELETCELELVPGLTYGDFHSIRILRSKHQKIIDTSAMIAELSNGEGSTQEFKETLLLDVKRAAIVPPLAAEHLRPPEILHSSLKSIAGFLTCGGGTLYIGVDDTGTPTGIEKDYPLLRKPGTDGWEIDLRNHIGGKFRDGNLVNDYVTIAFQSLGGPTVARLKVQARKQLSFLKAKASDYSLFRRQGNRSTNVPIEEIEEFLSLRKSKGWC